jgi:uncharacterized protein
VEYFFESHKVLVKASSDLINRELYNEIDWSHRLIGVKGFPKLSLDDILKRHREIVRGIISKVRPLAYFPEYLKSGLYPYFVKNPEFYGEILLRHIVLNYLRYFKNARLINLLFSNNTNGHLQKPDHVYLHNTNLLHI